MIKVLILMLYSIDALESNQELYKHFKIIAFVYLCVHM